MNGSSPTARARRWGARGVLAALFAGIVFGGVVVIGGTGARRAHDGFPRAGRHVSG